jgi:hypothetical protein
MSWHRYKAGQAVPRDKTIAACEEYIHSGKVIDIEGKEKLLDQIRSVSMTLWFILPETTVRNSPLNPCNWRTLEGQLIV